MSQVNSILDIRIFRVKMSQLNSILDIGIFQGKDVPGKFN